MQVVPLQAVVLVQDHDGIAAHAGEVIDIRPQEHRLGQFHGEPVHPVAQAVQQVQLVPGGKQELDFPVPVEVQVVDAAAEGLLERDAPYSLAVFVVQADGQALALVQLVILLGEVIIYGVGAGGNVHSGVPFHHLHLVALEGMGAHLHPHGGKVSGQIQGGRCRGESGSQHEFLQGLGQVLYQQLLRKVRSVGEGAVCYKARRQRHRSIGQAVFQIIFLDGGVLQGFHGGGAGKDAPLATQRGAHGIGHGKVLPGHLGQDAGIFVGTALPQFEVTGRFYQ